MGYDYRCTALNERCPKCGEWHSPYNKCPNCGYTTKLNECIKKSIQQDLGSGLHTHRKYGRSHRYTYSDYEQSHPDRLVCRICGSVYNKYKYEKCPRCYFQCHNCGKFYNKDLIFCPDCYIKCLECGRSYNKDLNFCPNCYSKCSKCGKVYSKNLKYCHNCYSKCSKCGKIYSKELVSCPYCNIECSECGNIYNTIDYVSCPHCKNRRDNLTVLGLCLAFIIFMLIMMFLF